MSGCRRLDHGPGRPGGCCGSPAALRPDPAQGLARRRPAHRLPADRRPQHRGGHRLRGPLPLHARARPPRRRGVRPGDCHRSRLRARGPRGPPGPGGRQRAAGRHDAVGEPQPLVVERPHGLRPAPAGPDRRAGRGDRARGDRAGGHVPRSARRAAQPRWADRRRRRRRGIRRAAAGDADPPGRAEGRPLPRHRGGPTTWAGGARGGHRALRGADRSGGLCRGCGDRGRAVRPCRPGRPPRPGILHRSARGRFRDHLARGPRRVPPDDARGRHPAGRQRHRAAGERAAAGQRSGEPRRAGPRAGRRGTGAGCGRRRAVLPRRRPDLRRGGRRHRLALQGRPLPPRRPSADPPRARGGRRRAGRARFARRRPRRVDLDDRGRDRLAAHAPCALARPGGGAARGAPARTDALATQPDPCGPHGCLGGRPRPGEPAAQRRDGSPRRAGRLIRPREYPRASRTR